MTKSYLGWPVRLRGSIGDFHITLKYFGEAPYTKETLQKRFKGLDLDLDYSLWEWYPDIWHESFHVLPILGMKHDAFTANKILSDIGTNHYPVWRPHITVTEYESRVVKNTRARPADYISHLGKISIFSKPPGAFNYTYKRLFS